MAPVAKLVMAAGIVTPLLMSGFRMLGAALLFWTASLFTRKERVAGRDLLHLAGMAMLGVVFNQGCYLFGVSNTSPGEAAVITTTMPLWVMLLAWLFLREPITWLKAGGIAAGATGAIMLVAGNMSAGAGGANPALGDILVLTAQLSYALYLTIYRNFISRYSVFTLMKWMFTFASVAVLPVMIPEMAATDWRAISGTEALGSLYVVVFGTFLAYICIMIAQKNLRPTLVGMYNYVQPIVATVVGVCIGLDTFTVMKGIAVALIFGGVFLVNASKSRQALPQPQPEMQSAAR